MERTLNLTLEEILYLEELLRRVQGTGQPIGISEGNNSAQSILDKLEDLE